MSERPLSAISGDSVTRAANVPLPPGDDASFREPRPPFVGAASSDSPRESYLEPTPNASGTLLAPKAGVDHEKAQSSSATPPRKKPRWLLLAAIVAALIIVVLAVILPVYFTVIKPKNNNMSSTSSPVGVPDGPGGTSPGPAGPSATPTEPTWGGDGTTVRATDGTTFTYQNKFGGICEYWSFSIPLFFCAA